MRNKRNRFFSNNENLRKDLEKHADEFLQNKKVIEEDNKRRLESQIDVIENELALKLVRLVNRGGGVNEIMYLLNTNTWSVGKAMYEKIVELMESDEVKEMLKPWETYTTGAGRTGVVITEDIDDYAKQDVKFAVKGGSILLQSVNGFTYRENEEYFANVVEALGEHWDDIEDVLRGEES